MEHEKATPPTLSEKAREPQRLQTLVSAKWVLVQSHICLFPRTGEWPYKKEKGATPFRGEQAFVPCTQNTLLVRAQHTFS